MSRPGEGQEGGREHSPSSLTPVTVREAERSYPRRGYCFLPKGKYRAFTDFFPQREIFGSPPCFSFPAKVDEKGEKGRFFQAGFFCGPHIFYAPAVIAAGGRPHGGRGSSPHLPASVRHTIRKKTKGSRAALLSASHRTGPRASAPAPGNLPMKREGRRTNQSVCPPAITPFPPVIPGTSPPAGTNPAGHPCSSVCPAAIPAAKPGHAAGAASQPLGSWQKPARKVPYPAASPAILIPGEELTCRGCSATGAAGHDSAGANRRASSTARRSAVPGWICSTERVAVSLNSCLTKQ